MKKLVFLAAVIVASLASCKKDRTCTCKYDYMGVTSSTSYTAKLKKKDAKTWCEGNGTSSYYTCTLD
ncbi:MAG: hypothetical protein J0M08_00515 [Bacteroidetes bacterium]|nr:hypothetical protein [Bacteroidota bacterium]